jgi:hypothetical protein
MDAPLIRPDDFLAAAWRQRLAERGLNAFETLWQLELPPLDIANESRGGISTAALLTLPDAGRDACRLVLKRQRNHQSRNWRHPLRGIPTLQKEFMNIRRFNRGGLATAVPVYFARRSGNEGIRAILMTEYLEGYQSLDSCLEAWGRSSGPPRGERHAILRQVADLIARMHRAGWQHNCLYPKHLFVTTHLPEPDVRLIDLEKAGRRLGARWRMRRDLRALFRRSPFWTPADQAYFMIHYHGAPGLNPEVLQSLRWIQQVAAAKTRRSAPKGRGH